MKKFLVIAAALIMLTACTDTEPENVQSSSKDLSLDVNERNISNFL